MNTTATPEPGSGGRPEGLGFIGPVLKWTTIILVVITLIYVFAAIFHKKETKTVSAQQTTTQTADEPPVPPTRAQAPVVANRAELNAGVGINFFGDSLGPNAASNASSKIIPSGSVECPGSSGHILIHPGEAASIAVVAKHDDGTTVALPIKMFSPEPADPNSHLEVRTDAGTLVFDESGKKQDAHAPANYLTLKNTGTEDINFSCTYGAEIPL